MKILAKNKKNWFIRIVILLLFGFTSNDSSAQVDPTDSLPGDPGGVTAYTVQNMSFGAFTGGAAGGLVTISTVGVRSVTGNVIPLNLGASYFQAIFEIEAPLGSIISILNGSDAILTGSNGGSMSMHIGSSDPPSPFVTIVTQPARTQVSIGGTLSVGNPSSSPPGTYTGTFYITLNQE